MKKWHIFIKRLAVFSIMICVGLCLLACENESQAKVPAPEAAAIPQTTAVETAGAENPDESQAAPEESAIRSLALEKTCMTHDEWSAVYDKMLLQSAYSHVTLSEDEKMLYPEMAAVLQELASMQSKAMQEEIDNLISFAEEELALQPDFFEMYRSTLDVQVRRADSVAISILEDSFSDHALIQDYRAMHGRNYDTESGQILQLSDVIRDMSRIPELVEQELVSRMWTGDFYSETAVADYFRESLEEDISWTLDYNGVTFYFYPGALAPEVYGMMTAAVSFAEYPELFYEKYMEAPEAYIVSLPLNASFFTDLNGDGSCEELITAGYYDTETQSFWSAGVYTDQGFYEEEISAFGFEPCYIKTADGDHYLYLFCESSKEEQSPMTLLVFCLNDGQIVKAGNMAAEPLRKSTAPMSEEVFAVLSNPEALELDDYHDSSQLSDGAVFTVGNDGMPEPVLDKS